MNAISGKSIEIKLSGFCPARCRVCSALRCSAADTQQLNMLKLLDRVVSGVPFQLRCVECDSAHR